MPQGNSEVEKFGKGNKNANNFNEEKYEKKLNKKEKDLEKKKGQKGKEEERG
jgi:hypothetical protein